MLSLLATNLHFLFGGFLHFIIGADMEKESGTERQIKPKRGVAFRYPPLGIYIVLQFGHKHDDTADNDGVRICSTWRRGEDLNPRWVAPQQISSGFRILPFEPQPWYFSRR